MVVESSSVELSTIDTRNEFDLSADDTANREMFYCERICR